MRGGLKQKNKGMQNPIEPELLEEQDKMVAKEKLKAKIKARPIKDYFDASYEINKFKKIASKYDILNMSINEANEMYNALYKEELIKLKDLFITLDAEKINDWQELTPIITSLKNNNSSSNEKINFLESIKEQAENNKENGSEETQNYYDEAVELAEKILYFQQSSLKAISA